MKYIKIMSNFIQFKICLIFLLLF